MDSVNEAGMNNEQALIWKVLKDNMIPFRPLKAKDLLQYLPMVKLRHPREVMALKVVGQIINELRNDFNCPILSGNSGFWVTNSEESARQFLIAFEKTTKAMIATRYKTYKSIKKTFSLKSRWLEQLQLFE